MSAYDAYMCVGSSTKSVTTQVTKPVVEQQGEQPMLDKIADWIGDAVSATEAAVLGNTCKVIATHGNNIVEISKKLPEIWAASVKASDEDIKRRMRAKFGV